MSISIDDNEPISPEVGQTSIDDAADTGKGKKSRKAKKAKKTKAKKTKTKKVKKEKVKKAKKDKGGINVWDVMMVISLICVVIACYLLVVELRTFSDFPFSYPWKTTDANF